MRKVWVIAGAMVCAALFCGSALVRAESSSRVLPVDEEQEKPLKPEDLKITAGKDEGFKAPMDVLKQAVKLSKVFKADDAKTKDALKACFCSESQEALDQVDPWHQGDKEQSNLTSIANFLLTLDTSKAKELAQSSYGNFAAVQAPSEKGMHFIRTVISHGNWKMISGYSASDFTFDFGAGMDDFKKAMASGNGAEVKKYVGEYENAQLELLSGVEGGDPYDLLAKKIKKMMGADIKPIWILETSGNEVSLWFHTDKDDAVVVINYNSNYNEKTSTYDYTPYLVISQMASLNKYFKTNMRSWNHYTEPESTTTDGAKDEKGDGGKKDSDKDEDGDKKDMK